MFAHFKHDQLRRYMVAFGSLFNRIELRRSDATGAEVQRLIVPIEYGPKEQWLTRLTQEPDLTQGVNQVLPRIAYHMSAINYDSGRKLNSQHNMRFPSAVPAHLARLYVGVPYSLTMNLDILTKTQDDGNQIVEQILPYFTPDLTFSLKVLPSLGLIDQIPLTLASVAVDDTYDMGIDKRRTITWSLTFTMKVTFYGPVKDARQITEVNVNLYNESLMPSPVFIETEDGAGFALESAPAPVADYTDTMVDTLINTGVTDVLFAGHVLGETSTEPNGTSGAHITAIATPPDQTIRANDEPVSVTTVSEY